MYNLDMRITEAQYERIAGHFPVQRGNVKTENRDFINAILYIAENGGKWRALLSDFGKWQTIYKKFSRWSKNGVIRRIFAALQAEAIIAVHVEVLALDSTSCKVHPDGHGALKNSVNKPSGNQKADGTPSFMWYPQMIRSSLRCISPAGTATMDRKVGSQ
jgi:transposase